MNEPTTIREILDNVKIIAVVGLTNKEGRASLGVSRFMQSRGYRIVPINPQIESSLGEKAYPTLDAALDAVGKIDLVNVFRLPKYIPDIVEDTIRLKIPYLAQDSLSMDTGRHCARRSCCPGRGCRHQACDGPLYSERPHGSWLGLRFAASSLRCHPERSEGPALRGNCHNTCLKIEPTRN